MARRTLLLYRCDLVDSGYYHPPKNVPSSSLCTRDVLHRQLSWPAGATEARLKTIRRCSRRGSSSPQFRAVALIA